MARFSKDNQPKRRGRPKGSISLKSVIREMWEEPVGKGATVKQRVVKSVKALVEKAEQGDVSAFKALAERLEGMPKQAIETTHEFKKMPTVKLGGKEVEYELGD